MAINPNEINIKNIIELIQSSSIKDNDLLVIGQGIYARKSTVLELYNKFGVPSILTSLNSLQFQINQLNNTVGNSVLYSPQVKTPQQKADARNNLDVYSRSETQTVVNTAIVNLGNVVNSVTSLNPALVDNSDPKNPVIAEFREISDYNNDMLNKADIDGNLTIGGIWFQDQVLSDRFANYKQVWTALSNNTIEWGNIELDKHIFLVDDINSLKIKVGGTEGTIWNTLNLTNVSQLANDAGYLQANDLDGFIYDVSYNSATHTITFYQQNEPNIVIDLPIESLIKGVQLVGDDLVFTFEDGSTVTVPLNTLLVGVVKSVNGLTPNSQGEIILNVTDIPNLSSELANKLDIRMVGLVSNLTQPEKDAILTKLGVVNNIVQVLGLSGNTITLSNGGGSISLNIANIGGLQTALDGKVNGLDGIESIGALGGNPDLPFFRQNGVTLIGLATNDWVTNNFASNTALGNYQLLLANGLHTTLSSNQVNVEFEINTPVTDKSGNTRLIFGNTSSTDIVIHGAVANGDFKVKDSTGADMFRMNGSNKVPYFPQLPSPQTMDGNLAIFDTGDGLWKHSINISDLVTTGILNAGLATKANVNGDNLTNIANWQSALGINTSWNLQQVTNNGNITTLSGIFKDLEVGFSVGSYKGFNLLQDYTFFNTSTNHGLGRILTNGILATDDISDSSLIPANGGYFKGNVVVPNGTLSGHAVNKSQLDAVSASIPTVGNGQLSFTAPTGLSISGTFNANQAGNTVVPITWQAGYQGYTTIESTKLANLQNIIINGNTYSLQNNPNITVTATIPPRTVENITASGGGTINITERKTRIVFADSLSYTIPKGSEEGDELYLCSLSSFTGDMSINMEWIDNDQVLRNALTYNHRVPRYFWWSVNDNAWLDVTT